MNQPKESQANREPVDTAEEEQLRRELPDLPDVSKPHVQRTHEQAHTEAEHIQLREEQNHEQPLSAR